MHHDPPPFPPLPYMCPRDLTYSDALSKCVPLHSCCTCHKLEEDGRIPGLTRCVALFSCVGPAGRHRCSGTFRCVFLKVEQSLRGTFAAFVCLRLCRGSPLCERRHAVMLASAQNKAWKHARQESVPTLGVGAGQIRTFAAVQPRERAGHVSRARGMGRASRSRPYHVAVSTCSDSISPCYVAVKKNEDTYIYIYFCFTHVRI